MGHLSSLGLNAPALFRALPDAAQVPWLPIGDFPTRVERIDGLLPRGVELWVKREDESARGFGGNKVRKLEFLFAAARAAGCARLVTFGGAGSHHAVATAIHGRALGFDVELLLFPQPADEHVRAVLGANRASGARVVAVSSLAGVLGGRVRSLFGGGKAWLAGGGSSATGTLGWVSGALEIHEQIAQGQLPQIDAVYGALGSGGTIAGLLCGLRGAIDLVAVKVVGWPIGRRTVESLARATSRRLARFGELRGEPARLSIDDRFLGRGYGLPSAESLAAVARAAKHGLQLDPIYTGKVMAALLSDAHSGRLDGKRVLFLHTHSAII
jgi:D-cysteine desulfhydrase